MLGSGAYGEVHVRDGMAVKSFHNIEKLKKMHPHRKSIPDITTPSFIRECMALCYLNENPHIVQVFEFDAEKMEISMELCNGDLREWKTRNMGKEKYFDTVYIYLRQIMKALVAMHDRGMVHGDIKMSNILVCSNGEACIGDLGFSTLAPYSAVYYTAEPYRDPHMKAHPCHDVYSFACTAYQLLTGKSISYREKDGSRRAFRGNELRDRVERHTPLHFRSGLLAMTNRDWESRPTMRKIYEEWFSEEIPVWTPTMMCVVPEFYTGKMELEHEIDLAKVVASRRNIERFERTCYALRYYVSENPITEYRLYVTVLLFLTHCCYHFKKTVFNFTLTAGCKYASCNRKRFCDVMALLMSNRDFLDCFYWNYW